MNIRVIFSILMLVHVVQVCGQQGDNGTHELRAQEATLIDERDRGYQLREMSLGVALGINLTLATKAGLAGSLGEIEMGEIAFSTGLGLWSSFEAGLARRALDRFRDTYPWMEHQPTTYIPGHYFLGGIMVGAALHSATKSLFDKNNFQSQDLLAPAVVIVMAVGLKNMPKIS